MNREKPYVVIVKALYSNNKYKIFKEYFHCYDEALKCFKKGDENLPRYYNGELVYNRGSRTIKSFKAWLSRETDMDLHKIILFLEKYTD